MVRAHGTRAARPARSTLDALRRASALLLHAIALWVVLSALVFALEHRVGLLVVVGPWMRALLLLLALGASLGAAGLVLRLARASRAGAGPATFAPVRFAFVALVLGWLACLAWGQPPHPMRTRLAFGAAAALYLAGGFAGSLLKGRGRRALLVLDLALFHACLLPVAIEGTLRARARLGPSRLLAGADQSAAQNLQRSRMKPGWMHYGFPHNSLGYLDDEFRPKRPGELRVVSISDSFGTGVVPFRYHFTRLSEEKLSSATRPAVVDNLGVPGIGPPEYLHVLLEHGLALEPDLVVLCLFVGNDIDVPPPAAPNPSSAGWRSWLKRADALTLLAWRRSALLRAERRRLGEVGGPIEGWGGFTLGERIEDPVELARRFPWLEDPALERPGMSEPLFRSLEASRALAICAPGSDPYPDFFASLEAFLAACGRTPCAVLLIPDEFQVEEDVWRNVLADSPGAELERDRPQRLLRAWLEERGLPYEDLLVAMRAVEPSESGRRHLYHLQDTHWNRRGNELAAERFAALVERALARRP